MANQRPHSDEPTLLQSVHDRTLAILDLIAHQPGISFDDLLLALEDKMGRRWAAATVYNDIKRIKEAGLLEDTRHRKGYFLAGPTMSHEDMRVLMNGLRIQARDLENPLARDLYNQHLKRFARTRNDKAYFGYPVEALGNRPVVRSTTDAISQVMEALREPILRGQRVRVRLVRDNWTRTKGARDHEIYPLQFVFNDVAWYLLCEHAERHTFFTLRLDRLSPVVEPLERSARGAKVQEDRLQLAKSLLERSWGFIVPRHDRNGTITSPLVTAKVWFHKDKAGFIEEANQRHPTQDVRRRSDGSVIFQVELPDEKTIWLFFKAWVLEWGASAEILEPPALRAEMAEELAATLARYRNGEEEMTSRVPVSDSLTPDEAVP